MTSTNGYEAKNKSKLIIRELLEAYKPSSAQEREQAKLSSMGPKKLARVLSVHCKTKDTYVFLEERYKERSSWQILWGEWSLGYKRSNKDDQKLSNDISDYDRLLFDLTHNGKGFSKFKFFYIVLSKHALIRMIMRSGSDIGNSRQAFDFLKKLTKKIVKDSLFILDGGDGKIIMVDGFYLPVVIENGVNRYGKKTVSITIKTIMPNHFKVNKDEIIDSSQCSKSLFEYIDDFTSNLWA